LDLGSRQTNSERLREAVDLFRGVDVEESHEFRHYVGVKARLGSALAELANLRGGTALLEEAIVTLTTSLDWIAKHGSEWGDTDWHEARIGKLLGAAHEALGLESGGEHLWTAYGTYADAQALIPQARRPTAFFETQCQIGRALLGYGVQSEDDEKIDLAVGVLRYGSHQHSKERMPLQWAEAQVSFANALLEKEKRSLRNDAADSEHDDNEDPVLLVREALDVVSPEGALASWARMMETLSRALRARGSVDDLEEAIEICEQCLARLDRDQAPMYWAHAQVALGDALFASVRGGGESDLSEAAGNAYEAALGVYTSETSPLRCAATQEKLRMLRSAGSPAG
jgi:tetratricopeptide (TPR) repeat protein